MAVHVTMIRAIDLTFFTNLALFSSGYPTERIEMTKADTIGSASKASLAMSYANKAQAQSTKWLSSGKRIDGGADDAAGVAVLLKMSAILLDPKAALKTTTDAVPLLATQGADVQQLADIIQRDVNKFGANYSIPSCIANALNCERYKTKLTAAFWMNFGCLNTVKLCFVSCFLFLEMIVLQEI